MRKQEKVFVIRHDGNWAVKKPRAERASAVFNTQAEAISRARELAGSGVLHIQGRHGKFRTEMPFDD